MKVYNHKSNDLFLAEDTSCGYQLSSDAAFNRSCQTWAISPRLRVFAKMLSTSRSISRLLNPQTCEVQFRVLFALLSEMVVKGMFSRVLVITY